jgi:hypothetical protein
MPRDFHTATAIGDLMFVFGGRSGKSCVDPIVTFVFFSMHFFLKL